jgi:DNA-binding beta-propeller fold protein YncE
MSDVFTEKPDLTVYKAVVPGNLCKTPVDPTLVGAACTDPNVVKTAAVPLLHNGAWWEAATKDFYFDVEDALDAGKFSRILWAGIKGNQARYPEERSRLQLGGQNRAQLLQKWQANNSRISAK